jgi:hypothetical protein
MTGKSASTVKFTVVLVAAALVSYLFAAPVTPGGADAPHKGPPLSSIAMMSRFAREQGLAVNAFRGSARIPFEAGLSGVGEETGVVTAATTDKRVNQDFSLTPQNETTIAVNPASPNMIIAGAHDYRLGNPIGAAFYTTFDSGFTWNEGFPPFPLLASTNGSKVREIQSPFGTGDPVLAFGRARPGFDLSSGVSVVYYGFLGISADRCEHGIFVSRSTNGLLWARPVVPTLFPPSGLFTPVYEDPAGTCNVFNDKPWLTVDNSGGPHDGRVYVTWSRFRFSGGKYLESPILMTFSDDNGLTWSAPLEVNGNSAALCRNQVNGRSGRCDESQFSNIVIGADGTLYVAFINQQLNGSADGFRNQYLVTRVNPDTLSVDGPYSAGGLIDGEGDFPVNALGLQTLCNSNFRLTSAGNMAIDSSDPEAEVLYLVFADNRNGSSFPPNTPVTQDPPDSFVCPEGLTTDDDVFVLKSTDRGVTWFNPATGLSSPLRVNQDGPGNGRDQWFPWVAIGPGGRVDIVFYDRRDDPFNRFTHLYLARSSDGGATWTDMRVSDVPSNMNWSFENGIFIGDYNALAIGPDGTSYPFWTDARNGTPRVRQSDVFMDAVPP